MTIFTLRSIPKDLHYAWKVISSLKSCSMRIYILRALRKQLESDITSFEEDNVLKDTLKKKLEKI